MSLRSLFNTRESVRFGGDVAVPKNDIIINGDLNINGTIDGSSTPANQNNTWTGTNDFAILPTSNFVGNAGTEVPNFNTYSLYLDANNCTRQANTWSGTGNTFNRNITCSNAPSGSVQAVNGAYLSSVVSGQGTNYTTANNAWTGINTFNITPDYTGGSVNGTDAVNKSYVDTTIIPGAVSTTTTSVGTGTQSLTQADFDADTKVYTICLMGGGGGSTSAVGAGDSPGVSGGESATGIFTCLVDTSVAGGFQLDFNTANGGSGGVGCGTNSGAGSGGGSTFQGFIGNTTKDCPQYNEIGWTAGGGRGFGGSCGDKGTAGGGTINYQTAGVQSLQGDWIGRKGTNGAGSVNSGWLVRDVVNNIGYGGGGYSSGLSQGSQGAVGGFASTSYTS